MPGLAAIGRFICCAGIVLGAIAPAWSQGGRRTALSTFQKNHDELREAYTDELQKLIAQQKDIMAATWKLDARARRGGPNAKSPQEAVFYHHPPSPSAIAIFVHVTYAKEARARLRSVATAGTRARRWKTPTSKTVSPARDPWRASCRRFRRWARPRSATCSSAPASPVTL